MRESFAPAGEFSLLQGRIKAIRSARNHIYIIDQYFIYQKELLEALLSVLPRLQKVVIVVRDMMARVQTTGYRAFQYEQGQAVSRQHSLQKA